MGLKLFGAAPSFAIPDAETILTTADIVCKQHRYICERQINLPSFMSEKQLSIISEQHRRRSAKEWCAHRLTEKNTYRRTSPES